MNTLLSMLLAQADEANHAADRALDQYNAGDISRAEAMAICNAGILPHQAVNAYLADTNWWDEDGYYHSS